MIVFLIFSPPTNLWQSFTQLYDLHGKGEKIEGPCILCSSVKQCEICFLKEEFKHVIDKMEAKLHPWELPFVQTLREKAHLLMTEPMPRVKFRPEEVIPVRHCFSTCVDIGKWRKRKKEGGFHPTIWECMETAAKFSPAAHRPLRQRSGTRRWAGAWRGGGRTSARRARPGRR